MNIIKELKRNMLVTAIVSLLFGLALVVFPQTIGNIACYILGGILIAYGVINIVGYFENKTGSSRSAELVLGLLLSISGLFIIVRTDIILSAISFVLGIFILLTGFILIQSTFDLKRSGFSRWWIMLILSAVTVSLGIVVIFNPFKAAEATIIFIGICLIYGGLASIFGLFCLKKIKKALAEDNSKLE